MRRLFIPVLLVPGLIFGNVDMIMGNIDQDELVVSWSIGESCYLGKYWGNEFHQISSIPGFSYGGLGIASDISGGKHVLYAVHSSGTDSINTYSYDGLTHEGGADLSDFISWGDVVLYSFLKGTPENSDALLAAGRLGITGSGVDITAYQIEWAINESGHLEPVNSAEWTGWYTYWWNDLDVYYPCRLVGPVACPGGFPLMATTFGFSYGWAVSHCFAFDPISPDLICAEIGEDLCTPEISAVMGLGCSSDSEPVLIFANDFEEVNWFEFSPYSPEPSDSVPLPWAFPAHDDPVTLSSTFHVPGILMVWYRDGMIRCRHWNGEWNNFDYPVSSTSAPVELEDIAVCTDADGYWIAWLETGEIEPQVAFMAFDEVTPISREIDELICPGVILRPVSNPVSENLCVEIIGVESGAISVIDPSGRVILSRTVQGEGFHSLGKLPCTGVYFLRLHCSDAEVVCKVFSNQEVL